MVASYEGLVKALARDRACSSDSPLRPQIQLSVSGGNGPLQSIQNVTSNGCTRLPDNLDVSKQSAKKKRRLLAPDMEKENVIPMDIFGAEYQCTPHKLSITPSRPAVLLSVPISPEPTSMVSTSMDRLNTDPIQPSIPNESSTICSSELQGSLQPGQKAVEEIFLMNESQVDVSCLEPPLSQEVEETKKSECPLSLPHNHTTREETLCFLPSGNPQSDGEEPRLLYCVLDQ